VVPGPTSLKMITSLQQTNLNGVLKIVNKLTYKKTITQSHIYKQNVRQYTTLYNIQCIYLIYLVSTFRKTWTPLHQSGIPIEFGLVKTRMFNMDDLLSCIRCLRYFPPGIIWKQWTTEMSTFADGSAFSVVDLPVIQKCLNY